MGTAAHPRKITLHSLAKILENTVLTATIYDRGETIGAKIWAETSLDCACDLITSWLASS